MNHNRITNKVRIKLNGLPCGLMSPICALFSFTVNKAEKEAQNTVQKGHLGIHSITHGCLKLVKDDDTFLHVNCLFNVQSGHKTTRNFNVSHSFYTLIMLTDMESVDEK